MTAAGPPPARASMPVGGRIVAIDVLRGVAILWVLLFHLWIDMNIGAMPPADHYHALWDSLSDGGFARALLDAVLRIGFQGVPLFMMLSGLSLYLASARGPREGVLSFYATRLRRVVIPYWAGFFVFFAGVCAVASIRVWTDGGSFASQYHHGVTVSAYHVIDIGWTEAFASLGLVTRLFRDEWFGLPPIALWFVVIIVQYYLLFPPLRALLDRVGPWWFAGGALLFTVAAKSALIAWYGGLEQPGARVLDAGVAPFRIFDFALGMSLGYLLVHRRGILDEYASSLPDIVGLVFFGLLLQIGGTLLDDRQGRINALGTPMVILGLTLIALPLIAKRPGRVDASVPARFLASIGVLSYAVLIINEPMRLFASLLRVERVPEAVWWLFLVGAYMPVTLLLARPFAVLVGLTPRAPRRALPTPATPQAPAEEALPA